jgi:hypothetical protein
MPDVNLDLDDSNSDDEKTSWCIENVVDFEAGDVVDPGVDVLEEVNDKLLGDGWVFETFSVAGSVFHGDLKGKSSGVNSIKLEYNSSDSLLFQKWKTEANEIMKNAMKLMPEPLMGALDQFSAFTVALPREYLTTFADWLNEALSREEEIAHRKRASFQEIVSFFKVEVALRYYGLSATSVKEAVHRTSLSPIDVQEHEKVRGFIKKADIPYSNQPAVGEGFNAPFTVDPFLIVLQDNCNKHWKSLFFIPGTTCVDLDDDKLPLGSVLWELYGIKLIPTKTRKKKPVVHLVGSIGTGFLISMSLELIDFSLSESIGKTVENLVGNKTSATAQKMIIFIDRGYLQLAKEQDPLRRTNIVQVLQDKGVKFLGTAKTTASFPMFEDTSQGDVSNNVVVNGRVAIPIRGTRSVFAATNRSTKVTALMMRHGMGKERVARLITNEPMFSSSTWVYETSTGRTSASPGGVQRLPHTSAPNITPEARLELSVKGLATLARKELESRVFLMTREQRTQDWFLARLFRCSSTNTHASMNCTDAVYFTTPKMRALHKAVKKTAQLKPRIKIDFENARHVVPEDVQEDDEEAQNGDGDCVENQVSTDGRTSARGNRSSVSYWRNNRTKADLTRLVVEEAKQQLPEKATANALATILANMEQANPGISNSWDTHRRTSSSAPSSQGTSSSSSSSSSSQSTPLEESNISDDETNEDPQIAFLQVMTKRWFLSPFQSGAKAGGALRVGSQNEASIGRNLKPFISSYSGGLKLLWQREYGLLVNRKVPFAADSPDGVGALIQKSTDGADDFFGLVALEFKTNTSLDTITKLRARVEKLGAWVKCHAGAETMREAIPNASYRTQVVHHAAVLGVSHTLLVYASPTRIEQAVLIEVTSTQRKSWLAYLEELQKSYMQFAYGSTVESPPRLGKDRTRVYGYAREHHTVDQYLGLWRAHVEDVVEHGTPPSATRILAKITSSWNKFMGNIDIARKVINSCNAVYRGLKPSGLVWMTCFDYVLYNAFRLWQTSTLLEKVDSFDTFQALTNARKKLGSFKDFLGYVFDSMHPSLLGNKLPGLAQRIDRTEHSPVHSPHPSNGPPTEAAPVGSSRKKRKIVRSTRTSQSEHIDQLRLSSNLHLAETRSRAACVLCCTCCERETAHKLGKSGKPLRGARVTTKWCSVCEVPVCKHCWTVFHTSENLPIPPCELAKL